LVELSPDEKSVEPILYEFNTETLYYPLLITSPIGGDGRITLFLITEDYIGTGFAPFAVAKYRTYEFSQNIQFELTSQELSSIDFRIQKLFNDKAWMTALVYEGPLDTLTQDLTIALVKGDVNGDREVDIRDIALAGKAFASYPGHIRWNPAADINKDDLVNIVDLVLIVRNFARVPASTK
jgi:hypothetical protein